MKNGTRLVSLQTRPCERLAGAQQMRHCFMLLWESLRERWAIAMTGGGLVRTLIGFSFVCTVPVVELHSQPAWSPQKNVEFIVPTAAGSTMDALARIIQDIWQKNRLVNTSMTVMVRPGSGGAIAWTYVSRKTGDGHYLAISGPTLLANDIMGIGDFELPRRHTDRPALHGIYGVCRAGGRTDQDRRRPRQCIEDGRSAVRRSGPRVWRLQPCGTPQACTRHRH